MLFAFRGAQEKYSSVFRNSVSKINRAKQSVVVSLIPIPFKLGIGLLANASFSVNTISVFFQSVNCQKLTR